MTHYYLHLASIGREAECRNVQTSLSAALNAQYDLGAIKGYWMAFVHNDQEAIEKLIPPDCIEITEDRFPFLYLRLNFIDGRPESGTIAAMVAVAGFERLPRQ